MRTTLLHIYYNYVVGVIVIVISVALVLYNLNVCLLWAIHCWHY
jgi:hypothetical protein